MCQCRDKLFSFIDFGTTKLAHLRRRVATPVLLFKIEPPAGKVSLYDKSSVLLRSEMITLTEKVLCRLHITRVGILLISAGGATLHLITGNNTAACIARKSHLHEAVQAFIYVPTSHLVLFCFYQTVPRLALGFDLHACLSQYKHFFFFFIYTQGME